MPKKISKETYFALVKDYITDPTSEFKSFGRWFCDKYKIVDAEIYYEEKLMEAGKLIGERWVENSKKGK